MDSKMRIALVAEEEKELKKEEIKGGGGVGEGDELVGIDSINKKQPARAKRASAAGRCRMCISR